MGVILMKRLLSFILAVLLVVTLTACSVGSQTEKEVESTMETNVKQPSSNKSSDEPVKITAAIADKVNVEDFNTNDVTIWIEKELNVDLEFTVYESTDYNNKINLMVSSGDKLEDIIFGGFADSMVYEWAQSDALTPLTDYFADKNLAVNLYDAMARVGYDFRGQITLPDGEIYYIPVLNQSYGNECQSKVWIYEPWLKELNINAPVTTNDFYEVLKKVVESDVNGNSKADEVGLAGYNGIYSGWFSFLMNAFVYTDTANNFMKVENGKLSYSFTENVWREGIEYIRKLVKEGCIPTETVTQDMQTWKTMLNTPDVTAFTFAYLTPSQITDVERKSNYIALAPLAGPNGVQYTQYNPSKASCGMIITADCKNPEIAFKVGDLLVCEENSIVTRFGARGKDWDYIKDLANAKDYISPYEGFDPYIVVYNDTEFWGSGSMQNRSWMQSGPYIRQYGIANGMGINPEKVSKFSVNEAAGICLYQQGGYFPDETIVKLIYNDAELEVVSKVSSTLQTYIEETMANWILGIVPLDDNSWNNFINTIKDTGAYDLLKVAQDAYDRSIK